jgi:5-hydroxyisourate hydrolase-like protein (transthyretin family)
MNINVRTNKTKEEFIKEMKERINIRKTIMDFVDNVYFPMMATKFDGKVYNARFLNALNEEAKKISERMYVKIGYGRDEIEIQMRLTQWNYNDYESILLKCKTNAEGRIDYEATINDKYTKAWIANFKSYMEEYQSAIDNYDEYMKVFVELANTLEKYNKLPYTFRGHLDKSWMRIY